MVVKGAYCRILPGGVDWLVNFTVSITLTIRMTVELYLNLKTLNRLHVAMEGLFPPRPLSYYVFRPLPLPQ